MQNGIPWWYFQRHGGEFDGPRRDQRRPRRRDRRGDRPAAYHRLRRLSGRRACRARRGAAISKATGFRSANSTVEQRARRTRSPQRLSGRLQGAGARRHPLRDLAQAVGQPDLQPDQRADALDAGRYLPVPAQPRSGRGDDARGAGGRRASSASLPRLAGKAHRRRRTRRQAQDLDAAGRRGRPRPEIEALVGAVVEARAHDRRRRRISTPSTRW